MNILITFLCFALLVYLLWLFYNSELGLKGGLSSSCFLLAAIIGFNFYGENFTPFISGALFILGGYFAKYAFSSTKYSKEKQN